MRILFSTNYKKKRNYSLTLEQKESINKYNVGDGRVDRIKLSHNISLCLE